MSTSPNTLGTLEIPAYDQAVPSWTGRLVVNACAKSIEDVRPDPGTEVVVVDADGCAFEVLGEKADDSTIKWADEQHTSGIIIGLTSNNPDKRLAHARADQLGIPSRLVAIPRGYWDIRSMKPGSRLPSIIINTTGVPANRTEAIDNSRLCLPAYTRAGIEKVTHVSTRRRKTHQYSPPL